MINKSQLHALNISHYSTKENPHPPGRCRDGCDWLYTKNIIDSYYKKQSEGHYHYALNKGWDYFHLGNNGFKSPCIYFDNLEDNISLNPMRRCWVYLLAYVEIYKPIDIVIEESVHPDLVSFTEYDGFESIDHEKVRIVVEHSKLVKCVETSKETNITLQALLIEAQDLTNSLIISNEKNDKESLSKQLHQLSQLLIFASARANTHTEAN
jgi:hypothetical protein